MRTPNIKLSLLAVFFLFSFGTGFSAADSLRAVVLEAQGDRIVINRGSADGVQVGQTFQFQVPAAGPPVVMAQAVPM